MTSFGRSVVIVVLAIGALAEEVGTNPLAKVISLLNGLTAKITTESEDEEKAFRHYSEWCDDTIKEGLLELKHLNSNKNKLGAKLVLVTEQIECDSSEISDLASSAASIDDQLSNATTLRKMQADEFTEAEEELVESIDALGRAISVLERERQANPAIMTQVSAGAGSVDISGLLAALTAVVDAASLPAASQQNLLMLVQSQQGQQEGDGDGDGDTELGAPSTVAYSSHGSGILEALEDLQEKANMQLSELRQDEASSQHAFALLSQSLRERADSVSQDMHRVKKRKSVAVETKAVTSGDLQKVTGLAVAGEEMIENTKENCKAVATKHAAAMSGRTSELQALAKALEILQESTGGAEERTYSFVQIASQTASPGGQRQDAGMAWSKGVHLVKQLARKYRSTTLMQLASLVVDAGGHGDAIGAGPFGKAERLIKATIDKLQKRGIAEAKEKEFCDREMAKTRKKNVDVADEINGISTRLDVDMANSAALKQDVRDLQSAIGAAIAELTKMQHLREESHAIYVESKRDLQEGLEGVKRAINTIRDYYADTDEASGDEGADESFLQDDIEGKSEAARVKEPPRPKQHQAATSAGDGILGILEVIETDFANNLASDEMEEGTRQTRYEKLKKKIELSKAMAEEDLKYKTQKYVALDNNIAKLSSDRDSVAAEQDAVLEFFSKLQERCSVKPEDYAARRERREAEIGGLKDALDVLQSGRESALAQQRQRGRGVRSLRGHGIISKNTDT
eukprot:TRINITY_DN30286_c0_g1_i1.p1 TRINITY_DN30286_c0_g1~~TRINITY_DN30286_c0_g1_i1.p1  ORF type:complete len:745 (+),score=180.73 TRINITY_DN30286_c0_g1_i1:64-2298(+)